MKISRRTVVKGIGAGIASAAIPANSPAAIANRAADSDKFTVQLAHQWGKDSLGAVIKNTSDHPATITNMTSVAADYGRFNFSELTDKGPLTLLAGEEIHVPFTVMGTPVKPYGHFDNRLQKKIKQSLKISTTNKVALVSTTMNPKIV